MTLDTETKQRISDLVASDKVVVFMKGNRQMPQCGFSATVTQILNQLIPSYATVNVLADPAIREGIKHYSDWPTLPQLYIDGKFVGGCDIVREMFEAGELHALLGVAAPAPKSVVGDAEVKESGAVDAEITLTLTASAKRALAEVQGGEPGVLRLEVSSEFEHALSIDDPAEGDIVVDAAGVKVLLDQESAPRANGVHIDYSAEGGGGFMIDNPNEPAKVRPLTVAGLKSLMESGQPFELFDVRTPEEREIASLPGARLFDAAAAHHISHLDQDTPLVFHCHHGGRSQAAAERFVEQGYRRVYNVIGGIDAWSVSIDATVPRY